MKKTLVIFALLVLMLLGGWAVFSGRGAATEIEYRYASVEVGDLVRSISANGQLVALTSVDVKSKAGGKVMRLVVDEGSVVKRGDLIAEIDPSDTKALFDQAAADVQSAQGRAEEARLGADFDRINQQNSVADAEAAYNLAKIRLEKAESDAATQPRLSQADLKNAEASLVAAKQALSQLERVTIPQSRKDAQVTVDRTRADMLTAKADMERHEELYRKGFVSAAAKEKANAAYVSATSSYETAKQRLETLESDLSAQRESQRAKVEQSEAALEQAKAGQSKVLIARKAFEEAKQSLKQAELALERAKYSKINVMASQAALKSAAAGTVKSRVSMENAKVQLESTTVVAPRDGVVTLKYLEEGTIIPPGTSTFAQGTSLVQISDTTRMFVECLVDEADIAQVNVGQAVRVIVEAYPGQDIRGKVERVNPAAKTDNNITSVKVRVEVQQKPKVKLLPGMTATCEFLTLEKKNVLIVPSQAVRRENGKSIVRIKQPDGLPPIVREVETGAVGNDGIEIVRGLKNKEQVVIAEINLEQLRETQRRMEEAQQGGGLASGGPRPGATRTTGTPRGGNQRPR